MPQRAEPKERPLEESARRLENQLATPVAGALVATPTLAVIQRWFQDTRRSVGALVQFVSPSDRRAVMAELDVFFRHAGRLMWLVAAQKKRVTAQLTWGLFLVLVRGAAPNAAAAAASAVENSPEEREAAEEVFRGAALMGLQCKEMPNYVRLECPRPVFEQLLHEFSLGELERELTALNESEKPQVRVNSLKTTRAELKEKLEKQRVEVAPGYVAPQALRVLSDTHLASLGESVAGLFELQMEGAQLAALMVEPDRKSRVLDMCAGAGSKTLALATMQFASIQSLHTGERALMKARARLANAGARNVHTTLVETLDDAFFKTREGVFDRVLVDAACSSSGSWGVNPSHKWSVSLARLIAESVEQQQALLRRAARMVRVGGRIVYVTNSILRAENERAVERFLQTLGAQFNVVPARQIWERAVAGAAWPCAQDQFLKLLPSMRVGGYFVAVLERTDVPLPAEAPETEVPKTALPEVRAADFPHAGVMPVSKSSRKKQ